MGRQLPVPVGLTQQRGKLEFVERSARPEQHCHSEPVRTTFVGISIEFWAIYRHPFVGAVIDRPQNCTEFQN